MPSLEVISLAVADVDRAIAFYRDRAGFHLDVDYHPTPSFRVVQLTPAGSACSIHLVASETPAPVRNLYLVTDDIAAERAQLLARGVAVGECRHKHPLATWSGDWAAGLDPERRDYATFADFTDPDGNRWTLQERGFRQP
ncbi:VOC domain-containing protein [Cupriavidus sp. H19C3]|uniref:VOC family protein n=1 Tax=Cupriavidus sp. H19C3 TaxID=3241603 RepID=UPI003BF86AEA